MNNTFVRINREQAQQKGRAMREQQQEMEKFSEYDHQPINLIVEKKHTEMMTNDFHDIDNVHDSNENDMLVERMLKKLGKEAIAARSPRNEHLKATSIMNRILTKKEKKFRAPHRNFENNNEKAAANEISQQELRGRDSPLMIVNDDASESPAKTGIFQNTEAFILKQNISDTSRLLYKQKLTKKLSRSALPGIKLSNMSIVEDPFTVRAIESFINDNYEPTLDLTVSSRKNSNPKLLLAAKDDKIFNDSFDQSQQRCSRMTPTGRGITNSSPYREMTSKRTLPPLTSDDHVPSQQEEFLNRFDAFQKQLQSVREVNLGSKRDVENFNAYLAKDHVRLKSNASRVASLYDGGMDEELDSIKETILEEKRAKQEQANSTGMKRLGRLMIISDRTKAKVHINMTSKMVEVQKRSSKNTELKLKRIFATLEES